MIGSYCSFFSLFSTHYPTPSRATSRSEHCLIRRNILEQSKVLWEQNSVFGDFLYRFLLCMWQNPEPRTRSGAESGEFSSWRAQYNHGGFFLLLFILATYHLI